MNKSFIAMLAAIESPEAIERGYQILAAKRDLLARNAEKTVKFAHTYMEPRPVAKTYSQERLEQEQARQQELRERGTYKLLPSLYDVMAHQGVRGEFLIRLRGVTPAMAKNGFHNGMVMKLVKGGHQTSTLRHVRSGRVAVIHNRYLESFFKPTYQGPANVKF